MCDVFNDQKCNSEIVCDAATRCKDEGLRTFRPNKDRNELWFVSSDAY